MSQSLSSKEKYPINRSPPRFLCMKWDFLGPSIMVRVPLSPISHSCFLLSLISHIRLPSMYLVINQSINQSLMVQNPSTHTSNTCFHSLLRHTSISFLTHIYLPSTFHILIEFCTSGHRKMLLDRFTKLLDETVPHFRVKMGPSKTWINDM